MDKYSRATLDAADSAGMLVAVLSGIAVVIAVVVGIFITSSITQPLGEAVGVTHTVAVT